jgi:hypothetical protein
MPRERLTYSYEEDLLPALSAQSDQQARTDSSRLVL